MSGNGVGDPGGDDETNVTEPAQLFHDCMNLLRTRLWQAVNGFGVVENDNHLL